MRHFSPGVTYRGDFYGQGRDGSPNPRAISVDRLTEVLVSLPPGTSELACHPALGADLKSMYQAERAVEVRTLCDPRVRSALLRAGVRLISFADYHSPVWE